MFKNIQNYLLLNHPLLWNLRVIPATIIMVAIHLIFFGIGYDRGAVDFTKSSFDYDYDGTGAIIIFFGVIISILFFIGWIVFYLRNNAFKSFYPQSSNSIYAEWFIIAAICIFNCGYSGTFIYGKDVRARSYFNEQEFSRRIDIISMASVFVRGSYIDKAENFKLKDGKRIRVISTTYKFKGKDYKLTSLLNKNLRSFSYQYGVKDSLNELRVKNWLYNNRKDSVLWLMTEFDKIAKSHKLKCNVTPAKWLSLIYNYPDFTKFTVIGKIEGYRAGSYDYDPDQEYSDDGVAVEWQQQSDTLMSDTKIINGMQYIYPKYYVPLQQLTNAYDTISASWENPDADMDLLIVFIYAGVLLSMFIFSYRVTSGRSWLIALVTVGITAIVVGGLTIAANAEKMFSVIWLLVIVALAIYFIRKSIVGLHKGNSAIVLNSLLWVGVAFVPLLYSFSKSVLSATRYDYIDSADPAYLWLKKYEDIIMALNIIFVAVYMYFFTIAIKKWKGIAEG